MNDISEFTGWCIALSVPAIAWASLWIVFCPPKVKDGTAVWLIVGLIRIILWPIMFVLQLIGMYSIASAAHDFIKRK